MPTEEGRISKTEISLAKPLREERRHACILRRTKQCLHGVAWPRNGEAGDAAGPFVPGLVSMEKLENFYLVVSTIANIINGRIIRQCSTHAGFFSNFNAHKATKRPISDFLYLKLVWIFHIDTAHSPQM